MYIHCVQKKTPTYIFNYNSGISWSIFIIFGPVEREINTLQFIYLQSWWRHNCVTLHATKVYFIELLLNIKYFEVWIEFEDKILIKNLWKCKTFYARRLTKNFVHKIKKLNIIMVFCESCKQNNGFDRTHSIRKRSAAVVSKCDVFTLTSVETQLR